MSIVIIFSFFRQLNKQPRIKIHKHLIICYALYHIQGITYNFWIKHDQKQQEKLFSNSEYAYNKIRNQFYSDWNDTQFEPMWQHYETIKHQIPNYIPKPKQNINTTYKVQCYASITKNAIINCTESHTLITQYLKYHDTVATYQPKLNSYINDEHLLAFYSKWLETAIFNSMHQTQICPAADFFYKSDSLYFCRFLQIFYWYMGLACHAWMFNEAINLHYQLVTKVFGGTQSLVPYRKKKINSKVF